MVAWLESQASDKLAEVSPPRFADGEGLWRETRVAATRDGESRCTAAVLHPGCAAPGLCCTRAVLPGAQPADRCSRQADAH